MVRKNERAVLDDISKDVKTIKKRLKKLESESKEDLLHDKEIVEGEHDEMDELIRLEELEREIHADVKKHPLAKVTYRDVTKGIIGAFFGIVGHFAFFYGGKIASELSVLRAHLLVLTSMVILVLFLYFSGYRRITKSKKHHYIWWRFLVIFLTAHIVTTFVLFLFGQINFGMAGTEIYKNIAAVSILAVMGAATADLIGGDA